MSSIHPIQIHSYYPLVIQYNYIPWKMAIEIVSFSHQTFVNFHNVLNIHQRVIHPIHSFRFKKNMAQSK